MAGDRAPTSRSRLPDAGPGLVGFARRVPTAVGVPATGLGYAWGDVVDGPDGPLRIER